ncbi:Maf family protein [Myxococcota bacterium]
MIRPESPLVLGSASPRRRTILAELGLPVRVAASGVPEPAWAGQHPEEYLEQVVGDKLAAVAALPLPDALGAVLVADTVVVVDDQLLGKPASLPDAERLLTQLVGRTHQVYTRYAIASPENVRVMAVGRTVVSDVTMRSASDEEIARYAQTGEGLDKAGAYAVQGIGAFLVERIAGSYTNVVGLPACEVVVDLSACGLLGPFPLCGHRS